MAPDASIFKAYDIRGIVDKTLTEDAVRQIGRVLGTMAHEAGRTSFCVGRDGRLSGERLAGALMEGITSAGVDVIDIGMVPTPVLYFATVHFGNGTGVAVTGSHNPPEYNGLKMMIGGITLFGRKADKDGMSSFQSLATAISAQVGTGNLAGVATAIAMGGPGAIFWMWIAAFFGMATIFSEAVLAQLYRTRDAHGHLTGGPAYYISQGLGSKTLAAFFSVAIIIALGFVGNMVQANSIAGAFYTAYRAKVPYVKADRIFTDDIRAGVDLLKNYRF